MSGSRHALPPWLGQVPSDLLLGFDGDECHVPLHHR
jgi:hypothetical protein